MSTVLMSTVRTIKTLSWPPLFVVAGALLLSQCLVGYPSYQYSSFVHSDGSWDLHREEGLPVFVEPPAPRMEDSADFPKPEEGNAVWVSGRWVWSEAEKQFVWQSGSWQLHEYATRWSPGYWKEKGRGWVWVRGFWDGGTPDSENQGTAQQAPAYPYSPQYRGGVTVSPALWTGRYYGGYGYWGAYPAPVYRSSYYGHYGAYGYRPYGYWVSPHRLFKRGRYGYGRYRSYGYGRHHYGYGRYRSYGRYGRHYYRRGAQRSRTIIEDRLPRKN